MKLQTLSILLSCTIIAHAASNVVIGGSFTAAINGDGTTSPPLIGNRLVQYNVATDTFSRYRGMGNDFNNDIKSIAMVPNGDLYVAGFYSAEGTDSNLRYLTYVNSSHAGWNPTYQVPPSIYSVIDAKDGKNGVIVGGSFANAGGDFNADYLAYWDGSVFSSIGSGFNNRIESMVWLGDNDLFVGGFFSNGPTGAMSYGAKWTRSTNQWNTLANNAFNNVIYAFHVVSATEIYVGGSFSSINGDSSQRYLARYNNVTDTVHRVGGCIPTSSTVYAIESSGQDLFVGGSFSSVEGNALTAQYVARFNKAEQKWYPLQDVNGNPQGLSNTVYSLKLRGDWLAIGGAFTTLQSGASAERIAFYNIQTHVWKYPMPSNNYYLSSTVWDSMWLDNDNILIAGDFVTTQRAETNERLTALKSGSFSPVDEISRNSDVSALAVLDANTVVVGGSFSSLTSSKDYLYKRTTNGAEPLFPSQALNSAVYALFFDAPTKMLWIGGGFTSAGCLNCRYVFGVNVDTKETHALPYDGASTVYALSVSTNSNGDRILNIGHSGNSIFSIQDTGYYSRYNINQRKYEIIRGTATSTVRALQTDVQDSKNVWIGGQFTEVNRQYNAYVASYNLQTDTFQFMSPKDVSSFFSSVIRTAVEFNGLAYLGGQFSNAFGNSYLDYMATYNPTTGDIAFPPYDKTAQSFTSSPFTTTVYDSQVYQGKLYVVGSSFDAGGLSANDYSVVYDPATQTWSRFCSGIPSATVETLEIIGETAFFGTQSGTRFYTCNITSDSVTTGPSLSATPSGFAQDSNNTDLIWIAGQFTNAGDANGDYLIQYNRVTNQLISPFTGTDIPNNAVTNVLNINGWIYAAGYFSNLAGDNTLDYIAKWNGSHWHHVTNQGSPNNLLGSTSYRKSGMTYIGNNRLVISGSFTNVGGSSNRQYVAEIDIVNGNYTNRWMKNTDNVASGPTTALYKTIYLPTTNTLLMLSGNTFYVNGQASPYIAKWDGANNQLTPVRSSTLNGNVYALAQKSNVLYVGGQFSNYQRVAKYDTSTDTWSALTTGSTNGDVNALLVDGNDLWIVGAFTTLFDVTSANRIGLWNGTHINKFGQGLSNTGSAIAIATVPALAQGNTGGYQVSCVSVDTAAVQFCASTLGTSYMTASNVGQHEADIKAKQAAMAGAAQCATCSKSAKQLFCHKFFPKCTSTPAVSVQSPCQAECNNYASTCDVDATVACASYPTTSCASGVVESAAACQIGSSVFADSPRHLYAAGSFYRTSGRRTQYMTCMNKQTGAWFNAPRCLVNNQILTMAPDGTGNGFYFGGDFTSSSSITNLNRIGHYNYVTDTYTALSNGLSSTVRKIEKRGELLWIAGDFTNAPNSAGHRFITYNITSKTYAPGYKGSAPSSDVYDFEFSGDGKYVYLAGVLTNAGGVNVADYFVQLDLNNGTYTPTVWNLGNTARTIAKIPNQDLFYVGGDFTAYNGFTANRLIRYDPASDKLLPWSSDAAINSNVYALANAGGNMFVAGQFSSVSGVTQGNYIVKFDTTTGTPSQLSANGVPNNQVRAAVFDGVDGVYFGGYFSSLPNVGNSYYVGLFNTTTGEYVSMQSQRALTNAIQALLWDNGVLYAGGSTTGGVATWSKETNTWSPIGGGVGTTVYALEKVGNILYVGGSFTQSYDSDAPALVSLSTTGRWTSYTPMIRSWSTEGTNYGKFLAEVDGELYIGGNMYRVYGGANTFYPNKVFKIRRDNGEPEVLRGGVFGGSISGMSSQGGNLIVTGSFTSVDTLGTAGAYFALWSGAQATWSLPRKDASVKMTGATYQSKLINELFLGCQTSGCFEKTVGTTVTKYSAARYHLITGAWTMVGSPVTADSPISVYMFTRVKDTFYVATSIGLRSLQVGSVTSEFKKVGCFTGSVYSLIPFGNGLFVGGAFANAGIKDSNYLVFYDVDSGISRIAHTKYELTSSVTFMMMFKNTLYITMQGDRVLSLDPQTMLFKNDIGLDTEAIRTMTVFNGNLVAIGDYEIGGLATRRMASVNVVNGQWSNLENGTDSTVHALKRLGNYLYVGGSFTQAGSVQADRFARFNLQTGKFEKAYNPVKPGVGISGTVRVIKERNGKLYLGGDFGSDPYNGVSAGVTIYDPATEQFTPVAQQQQTSASVYALDWDSSGKMWFGGTFSGTQGRTFHDRILEFEPSGRVVKNLGAGVSGTVNKIAVDPSDSNILFVGGGFTRAGDKEASYIASFNRGTRQWSAVGDPKALGDTVYNLHVTADMVIATGSFVTVAGRQALSGAAKFDRNTNMWMGLSSSQPDLPSTVYSVVSLTNAYCVGGSFSTTGGTILGRVAKRNETSAKTWLRLESHHTGPSSTVEVLGASIDGLAAGGSFNDADKQPNTAKLAFYNGTAWGSTADTTTTWFNNNPYALTSYNENLLVGGSFSSVSGFATRLLQMGADFTVSSFPCGAVSSTIRAMALNGTADLYVAGDFSDIDGTILAKGVARYDIASGVWSMLGESTFSTSVYSLLVKGKHLYLGGNFNGVGGETQRYLTVFDKSTSKYVPIPLSPSLSSSVYSVVPGPQGSGDVYVAGQFSNFNGDSNIDYMVRFNVNSKQFFPMNPNGGARYTSTARAQAVHQATGTLYIVGSGSIRRWTGTSFTQVPGAYDCGTGYAIEIVDDTIYYSLSCNRRLNKYNITSQTYTSIVNSIQFNNDILTITHFKPGYLFIGGEFSNPGRYAIIYDIANDRFLPTNAYFNNWVRASAVHGNHLYIGGQFSDIGLSTNYDRYLVKMDINTLVFSTVGTGVNNAVYTLETDNDYLYIGGALSNSYRPDFLGSSYGMMRFKYSTQTFEPMESGVSSTVETVSNVPGTNFLVIGGHFSSLNADNRGYSGFTRFDRFTNKFDRLDVNGNNGPTTVYSLLDAGDRIYAVGTFSNAYGDNTADYVFAWNTVLGTSESVGYLGGSNGRAITRHNDKIYGGHSNGVSILDSTASKFEDDNSEITGFVYDLKSYVDCQPFPASGFCKDQISWTIGVNTASDFAKLNAKAEERFNKIKGNGTEICNKYGKLYACASVFPACHHQYSSMSVCRSTCQAANLTCNGTISSCDGLPVSNCWPKTAMPDYVRPVNPFTLSPGEIAAIVIGSIIFVGACAAGILYWKHPPFKAWVDIQMVALKAWWSNLNCPACGGGEGAGKTAA